MASFLKTFTTPAPFYVSLVSRRPSNPVLQSLFRPRQLKSGYSARLGSTMAEDDRIQYEWIKGVETLEEYRPGGYHPVMIGDVLNDRYHIADKLGSGGYSTVWLALDTQLKRYVAVKVNTANSPLNETNVIKALSDPLPSSSATHPRHGLIPLLLDEFEVQGPNGKHMCYTVTPAQCNLRDARYNSIFSLEVGRALSYGLTQAVAYTHSQGYVHGDIHLSNVLVKLPSSFDDLSIKQLYEKYGEPETVPVARCDGKQLPFNIPAKAVVPLWLGKDAKKFTLSDVRPLLSDFGEAFSPASEVRLGQDCHTPTGFRAPEAKFEPQTPLSYSSDIWSLATAIWELVGLKPLFSTGFASEDEIVAQHVDVLGPMPSEWWQRWEERTCFFDDDGCPTESYRENQWPPLPGAFEDGVQKFRRRLGDAFEEAEKVAFLDLMRRMLSFRPEERPTAEEVLKSEWMVKWALPDYERS